MKSSIKILTLLFAITFALNSCKKDDITTINNNIQNGRWRVILFMEDNDNETSDFNGYEFDFNDNGAALAIRGNDVTTGTWSTGGDNSTPKFFLNFGNSGPLDELNEDWHVLEHTPTLLRLQHISGGNGGTDNLTLQRI